MTKTRSITVFLTIFMRFCFLTAQNQNESFDPSVLKNYDPDWPILLSPTLGDYQITFQDDTTTQKKIEVEGYRLQVFATKSKQTADSLKTVLEGKLDEPVFVKFEVPNYKVRVGNCKDRSDAEALQTKLAKSGYPFAWIVRTRIELYE